jgi:Carboxypeptidase regulatory-like domain
MRLTPLALLGFATVASAQSAITGRVVENGAPVSSALVDAIRLDKSVAREALTDTAGRFRLAPLSAGLYTVTVRKVGYRSVTQEAVRVADGQTVSLSVSLTQAPRVLSTIQVVTSPTSINAATPEMALRLDRQVTELLPTARDASSLIALVPGARPGQLWGGAPGVSNDYQLDGVSMNHPGVGGDFLSLSVDWIEALDVRGLGAGAEHGNFQGGIINAITKTGTNDRRTTFRTNFESERLTATNLNAREQGVEQAGRREVSGEALGPIARDKLFYFVGAQVVGRDLRSPNLLTPTSQGFQPVREEHLDARGLAKLTWLPDVGHRVDALLGVAQANAAHAGINGIDDPTATARVHQPTVFYELGWSNSPDSRNAVSIKLAGYNSQDSQLGYQGSDVPGIQLLQPGRLPTLQNAAFDDRQATSNVTGTLEWRATRTAVGAEHELHLGAEASRGRWLDSRTRNGGVTWRPYSFGDTSFNALNAATWGSAASDWGGDIHLDSYVSSEALFAQDYIAIGTRLTVTPGLRFGRWSGDLRPNCVSLTPYCDRFEAATATGFDPRIGAVWDVTGRNTFALKAHWGRYHQGMYSLFFDRATGGQVYSNHRFYYTSPSLTDSRTAFTTAQRDAPGSGFSSYYGEEVLDETGRVENYKQPYVDQAVLGLEKSIGPSWKTEVSYTHRRNRDIVGIIDRNSATNYSPLYNAHVNDSYVIGRTLDQNGKPLVLPVVYVSNKDLKEALLACRGIFNPAGCPTKIGGYTLADPLLWNPDLVLTTIPEAKRTYDQLTFMLRTFQPRWRGEASITEARLRGNTPGVAGFGTTGTRFSAGPYAHPNEAINNDGPLPDALELEGKVWFSVQLPHSLQGGVLFTHTLGELFTAGFQFDGRFRYVDDSGGVLPFQVFKSLLGQTLFVEPRGSRHYASRDVMDLHLEWRSSKYAVLAFDLFNALGSNALTSVNSIVGNKIDADPTTYFMAARLRVPPRTLRVGIRVE